MMQGGILGVGFLQPSGGFHEGYSALVKGPGFHDDSQIEGAQIRGLQRERIPSQGLTRRQRYTPGKRRSMFNTLPAAFIATGSH